MADYDGGFSVRTQYWARLSVWLISQDVNANTSQVGWSLTIYKNSGSGYYNGYNDATFGLNVDGATQGWAFGYDFTAYSALMIATGSKTVTHDADGTKTISNSFSIDDNPAKSGGNLGLASGGGTMVLPAIPRATTPVVTPNPVDAGSAATIDLSGRASGSFTHEITYSFGALTNQTAGLSASSGVGTSATFTPPMALLNQIPNATSGTCVITVVTKNGGTTIGTKTVNLTVQAPASVRPTISSLSISEATLSPDVASIVGAYVQGVSKLNLAIVGAAGAYGSSIASYKITVGSQTINAASGTTPNPIGGSGTITVNAEVTDSRGRVSVFSGQSITVLEYSVPQVTAIQVQRSSVGGVVDNTDGEYIRVDLTAAVQSLIQGSQKNRLYYKVFTSPQDANTWTQRGSEVDSGGLTYNSNFVVTAGAPYSKAQAFDVRIEVRDNLGIITTVMRTIATGAVLMDLNAGLGVGIGKYHQNGMLDVQGDIYMGGYKVVDLSRIASTTQQGIVEIATDTEVAAGTDATRAVTPSGLVAFASGGLRRNLILNGAFTVNQRSYQSGAVCEGYSFDRWLYEDTSGTNYNTNSDFEAASTGWTNRNGGVQARSSAQKRRGTYSMAVTRSGSGDDYVDKTITGLTNGAWYRVSAWLYIAPGGGGSNLNRSLLAVGGGTIPFTANTTIAPGRWTYQTMMVQASGTSILVRVYAVAGTTVYVDDLTVTPAPSFTYTTTPQGATVTVGANASLRQIIERQEIPAGNYTLTWTGTATARVYNYSANVSPPAYAAGPITVTLDGLDDVVVEFTNGTVTNVNLTLGTAPIPYSPRPYSEELRLCQRYYWRFWAYTTEAVAATGGYSPNNGVRYLFRLPSPLRAMPRVWYSSLSHWGNHSPGNVSYIVSDIQVYVWNSASPSDVLITASSPTLPYGQNYILQAMGGAPAWIDFDCEM